MRRLLLSIVACVACACSSSSSPSDASSCPNDRPTCPTSVPSYKDDISGIMDAHCNGCHGPGGTAAEKPLLTYDDVFRQRGPVLDQTFSCLMPPPDQRPMTPQQRANLLAWLVCGAPNN